MIDFDAYRCPDEHYPDADDEPPDECFASFVTGPAHDPSAGF